MAAEALRAIYAQRTYAPWSYTVTRMGETDNADGTGQSLYLDVSRGQAYLPTFLGELPLGIVRETIITASSSNRGEDGRGTGEGRRTAGVVYSIFGIPFKTTGGYTETYSVNPTTGERSTTRRKGADFRLMLDVIAGTRRKRGGVDNSTIPFHLLPHPQAVLDMLR